MKIKPLMKSILKIVPDEAYLRMMYKYRVGLSLNLKHPITFNEKLQWLKLYNRNPLYTSLVDKCEVKKYVANIIGEDYIIPTIGIWNSFDEINFDELPEQFVLKCTHDSGGVIICKNKSGFNYKNAKKVISKSLKRNYYYSTREWPYKNVIPRIIAEKYMEDKTNPIIDNWKFFCADGVPFIYYVTKGGGHSKNMTLTYFDMDDNKLDVKHSSYPNEKGEIALPKDLQKMKDLAALLSRGMPFVRVDFYYVNGQIYFGELTFFPDSGFAKFEDQLFDEYLGDFIRVPKEYGVKIRR